MKALKFLGMLLAAMTLSFTTVSCGDDDDPNLTPGTIINNQKISELKDNGSELSYSLALELQSIKYTLTFVYGYDSQTGIITSSTDIFECNNSTVLNALYEDAKSKFQLATVTKEGNKVICKHAAEDYANMTKEDVLKEYETVKAMQNR